VDKIRFIDLFAGIGGMRLAFEDYNTRCVFSSEWDRFAQKTYEANFGDIPSGDITKINEYNIPDHDILIAGFPCQPFSNIGRREGFAHATQGTLFFDILRILRVKRPEAFLLENVAGLLTIQNGEAFRIIKESLESIDYTISYKILDAADFGLPQVRKRIYIVGFRNDIEASPFIFPRGNKPKQYIKDYLEANPIGYSISKKTQENYLFKKDDGRPQIVDETSLVQVKTLVASYHKIQRLTGTFVRGGETGLRLFSELECKRIMGFPDEFVIPVSRTQMYRQFGNSVAVPVVKEIADRMKEQLRRRTGEVMTCQLKLPITM
jgi:DNA (cytosine-5)-methyltransferase 1